jgi:hypothetical protein
MPPRLSRRCASELSSDVARERVRLSSLSVRAFDVAELVACPREVERRPQGVAVVAEVDGVPHALLKDRPRLFEVAFLDGRVAEEESGSRCAEPIAEQHVDRKRLLGVKPRCRMVPSIGRLARGSDERVRTGGGWARSERAHVAVSENGSQRKSAAEAGSD